MFENRLDSAADHAKWVIAASVDIFNGEPIRPFLVANSLDNTNLRVRQHELRLDIWKHTKAQLPAPAKEA